MKSKTYFLLLSLATFLMCGAPAQGQIAKTLNVNPSSSPVQVHEAGTPGLPTDGATATNQAAANTKLDTIIANQTNGTQVTTPLVATTVKSTAFQASLVLKASAGRLCSLQVFNSSASAQYILVMDSATVPANGAVTLLCPPIYIAAGTYIHIPFHIPLSAANGISVSNSSTGSFTKTIGSADCAYTGQVL